ncbi:hypothetical protein C8R43DRAFT_1040973 [Mycena crocata]|nr:hypothetical protein C8R43DRAFT_1040973 [Mycena crocata]
MSPPSIMSLKEEKLDPTAHEDTRLMQTSSSASSDWLATMIISVKTVAAGAEFIPMPYIRTIFSTVLVLLETVDKIKKNRDDLRELCESTVEVVLILQNEVSAHGEAVAVRFIGLCENFISLLRVLLEGLHRLRKRRHGLGGRISEIFKATSVADQIARYKNRMSEMRLNFLLMTAINTNLKVAAIQKTIPCFRDDAFDPGCVGQFRNVAVGDINLLYETPISSRVHKIKVFTARISGEPSLMTVAKYEDGDDKLRRDLELYSNLKNPNVWQLFGISVAPSLRALIFYDEVIPLPIYRRFHRPEADLVWVCIEAILFKQFKDASQYHRWKTDDERNGLEAAICIRQRPVRICLTLPESQRICTGDREEALSLWHYPRFKHRDAPSETAKILPILATHPNTLTSRELVPHLDLLHFLVLLLPAWVPELSDWRFHRHFYLGSIVAHSHTTPSSPIGYIAKSFDPLIKEWTSGEPSKSSRGVRYVPEICPDWNQFGFPPNSFEAAEVISNRGESLMSTYIEFDATNSSMLDVSWLSQANMCIGPQISDTEGENHYGLIDTLGWTMMVDPQHGHILRPEGTAQEVHLFVRPIRITRRCLRIGITFPQDDCFYWSLDSSGVTRLSQAMCDSLGIPRLQFVFFHGGNCWQPYHYNAIRDFFEEKGFDSYGPDVTHLLGLPIAEMDLDQERNMQILD